MKIKNGLPNIGMIALLTALLIGFGCMGEGEDDDQRQEFGSDGSDSADWGSYYNTDDEQPGFGDPEILAMVEDDLYDDPFNTGTKTASAGALYVRVLWGNLIFDPDQQDVHNYSGTISIDDGLLVIERTVRFENHDSEIEVREDPTLVAWRSIVLPHYDGLVLRIEPGVTADANNYLHLNIGPYTADYSLAQLADMVSLEPTGLGDDQVAIASRLSAGEQGGFVTGHWRDLEQRTGGVAKGKWETGSGTLLGHLRCRYYPTDEDAGDLRGKYIDTDGNFQGLLSGEYEGAGEDSRSGEFDILWLDATNEIVGHAQGIYFKRGSDGYGFALGNWWTE